MSSVLPLLMSAKGPLPPAGDLYGWGSNSTSQIGDNMGLLTVSPTAAPSAWKDIAACVGSGDGSTGIKTNGTLWTWGDTAQYCAINSTGFYTVYSPVQVGTDTDWNKCFKQYGGGFAIKNNGTLWAWGVNAGGACGILSATDPIISPVQVGTATDWSFVDCSISGSGATSLGIKTNGTLWSWGVSSSGTLGNGTTSPDISSPVQVGTLTNWSKVSIGNLFVTAVKTDGTLWAWGVNTSGQLGDGTLISKSSPVQIGTLTNWSKVSSGSNFSVAVKTNGTLWSWGVNGNGQLGDGTTIDKSSPVQIGTLTTWSQSVSSFVPAGFALKTDGTLWSWGNNQFFELGDGTAVSKSSPVQIGSFGGVTTFKLMSGWSQGACFLLADSTLYGWGGNPQLNVGINGISPRFTTTGVAQASFGVSHSCFVKKNGTLWGNGSNTSAQLGQGNFSTIVYKVPVQIGALTTWSQVSASNNFTLAVKTDGTLWGWGVNSSGQLGEGTNSPKSSPVQIGTLTTWSKVSSGSNFAIALKTDGTLWAWGANNAGQLGDSTLVDKNSPVQVGTINTWSKISAGFAFSLATRTNGTLWAWGTGTSGQLGNGTSTTISSPGQVGALSNWSKVSSGSNFSLAVKTDGTLWSWGNNGTGQLGDGTTVSKSSPIQIGALTNWSQSLASSQNCGYALNTSGSVWAWGSNTRSQLGNGDQTIISVSSPVQIASSGYTSLASNALFSTAGGII